MALLVMATTMTMAETTTTTIATAMATVMVMVFDNNDFSSTRIITSDHPFPRRLVESTRLWYMYDDH